MKIVALLPMKANSQRVTGKNFRDLCGRPLFCWILNTLLAIERIDQVIINTDARGILASNDLISTDRVMIRDRKPEICGDHVSMNLVLGDDVDAVDADIYLMTHTTNPLLSQATIERALDTFIAALESNTADTLFSVNRFQSRFYRQDGSPINHDPDNLIPTQNLEPWFEENSNLYLFTRGSFYKTKARIGLNPMLFTTPIRESFDIDTPEDWELVECIAKHVAI